MFLGCKASGSKDGADDPNFMIDIDYAVANAQEIPPGEGQAPYRRATYVRTNSKFSEMTNMTTEDE